MSRTIRLLSLIFVLLLSCASPALAAEPFVISTPRYLVDIQKHWSKSSVEIVIEQGLMTPVSADQFAPDASVTRAELVEALYRLGGTAGNFQAPFTDVSPEHSNYAAITWGYCSGIIEGSDNRFRPDDSLTREELAVIFHRYAAWKGYTVYSTVSLSDYQDSDCVSRWAVNAMSWALEHQLITGMTADTLVPGGTATRAQLAVILLRYESAEKDFCAAPAYHLCALPLNSAA